ncbi:MAG: hypothetical protein JXR85_09475 [Deltaproteobacteria bacterium]|nr:hypothetical protein [Deltaproteobacteria bacterium]
MPGNGVIPFTVPYLCCFNKNHNAVHRRRCARAKHSEGEDNVAAALSVSQHQAALRPGVNGVGQSQRIEPAGEPVKDNAFIIAA